MSSEVWVSAVAGVFGAAVGGALSLWATTVQQRHERQVRLDEQASIDRRRSFDRRYEAFADFMSKSRAFRNCVRALYINTSGAVEERVGAVERSLRDSSDASSIVFLVTESGETRDACAAALRAMSVAHAFVIEQPTGSHWAELSRKLGRELRLFQQAARNELGVPMAGGREWAE